MASRAEEMGKRSSSPATPKARGDETLLLGPFSPLEAPLPVRRQLQFDAVDTKKEEEESEVPPPRPPERNRSPKEFPELRLETEDVPPPDRIHSPQVPPPRLPERNRSPNASKSAKASRLNREKNKKNKPAMAELNKVAKELGQIQRKPHAKLVFDDVLQWADDLGRLATTTQEQKAKIQDIMADLRRKRGQVM
jgi:hypothetical protein